MLIVVWEREAEPNPKKRETNIKMSGSLKTREESEWRRIRVVS
jgi:hypothetical protein